METKDLAVKPTFEFTTGPEADSDVLSQKKINATADADRSRLPASNEPTPVIALARGRFALTMVVSLAVLVAVMVVFVHGVVIDTNVLDELGSSKHVDGWVETYQVINGYLTAAFGMILEGYFIVFVAVAVTFMKNVRLYPGDDPRAGGGRIKLLLLAAFPPVVMWLINVAIAAMFVSHKTTGVLRVFLQDDLVATSTLSNTVLNATTAANLTSLGNGISVFETILKGAVSQKVVPFELDPDSKCVVGNETNDVVATELPSVKEIRSTAVVYGFPALDWGADALPFGLKPTQSVTFQLKDVNKSAESLQQQFDEFQKKTNVSWLTTYELLLQGKLLFERSVSDSNVSAAYPCVWVDGKSELDKPEEEEEDTNSTSSTNSTDSTKKTASRRRLQAALRSHRRSLQEATEAGDADNEDDDDVELEISDFFDVFPDGPYKGKRRCYGARSSLGDLANISDPSMHTVDAFKKIIVAGFVNTAPDVEPESMDLSIETFLLNPELKMTSVTLDMPYFEDRQYRNTTRYCNGSTVHPELLAEYVDNSTTKEQIESLRKLLCDQDSYPFMDPRSTCGHTNCIFLDQSGSLSFKKQLQLMPYLTNCNTSALQYDADFLNFFPKGCVKKDNAVFLYGLGSYMAGDSFDSGFETDVPYIDNPKRHIVLTFAKLEWRLQDLSTKFQAECGVNSTTVASRCMGLLHDLENVTVPAIKPTKNGEVYKRVLVLGQDQIPSDRMEKDFRNPVQLVSLNTRPFYYTKDDRYYEWENLDVKRFNNTDWPDTIQKHGGLDGKLCSPIVDAYIKQVDENHLYIDDPRQPLYTSALLYLFQSAAVKSVKLVKNATTGVELLELSVVGTTALKGDLERHNIKFSIPLLSLISTFAGLGFMVLLAVLAVARPSQRFKMSEDAEENATQQYLRFHQEDEYPEEVFDRGLKLPAGERVQMDDYVVESLTLHHIRDEDKKMYL